jgi:hypothetical protein
VFALLRPPKQIAKRLDVSYHTVKIWRVSSPRARSRSVRVFSLYDLRILVTMGRLKRWPLMYALRFASTSLASDTTVADTEVRDRLRSLVAEHRQRKPPTRAQLVRDHLTFEIRPVRSLLSALMVLPWQATPGHPVLAAIQLLRASYEHDARELPTTEVVSVFRTGV